jgi:hypothetical protein
MHKNAGQKPGFGKADKPNISDGYLKFKIQSKAWC